MKLKSSILLLLAGITPAWATPASLNITARLVADNDYAIFAGTNNSITSLLFQNNAGLFGQPDATLSIMQPLDASQTYLYLLVMNDNGSGSISGTINGLNIVGGAGIVQRSSNLASYLTGYSAALTSSAVSNGSYNASLEDVQSFVNSGTSWNTASTGGNGFGAAFGQPALEVGANQAIFYRFSTSNIVPEPSTYGFMGIGALAVAFAARRRKLKTA